VAINYRHPSRGIKKKHGRQQIHRCSQLSLLSIVKRLIDIVLRVLGSLIKSAKVFSPCPSLFVSARLLSCHCCYRCHHVPDSFAAQYSFLGFRGGSPHHTFCLLIGCGVGSPPHSGFRPTSWSDGGDHPAFSGLIPPPSSTALFAIGGYFRGVFWLFAN
jgi:hypothetical protein